MKHTQTMKKILLTAAALVASALSLSAQIVKGDMNDDGQLTVADLSSTASRILESAPLEYISTGGNPYQADNNLIVGTWYSADGQTVTFNSDGTQDLLSGYQFKYQPALGRILFTAADGKITVRLVYDFDGEKLIIEGDKRTLYFSNTKPADPYTGHEYVDLGLSVKWATCNVGADNPEDYGLYFAWGETTGYTQDTNDGHYFDLANYKWCNGSYDTMTKYCTNSIYGTVDNKTTLELADDAAHVNWGGSWRMPTKAELYELRNNCTWTWTTQNGVNGYKVVGKNGNSIFLPAAGSRWSGNLDFAGSYGYYWSSSLGPDDSSIACDLYFSAGYWDWYGHDRYKGSSVRAVCP